MKYITGTIHVNMLHTQRHLFFGVGCLLFFVHFVCGQLCMNIAVCKKCFVFNTFYELRLPYKNIYKDILGYLRNELKFWFVHRKGFTLTWQETRSSHDSMNRPKIEFIAYIYIQLYSKCLIKKKYLLFRKQYSLYRICNNINSFVGV